MNPFTVVLFAAFFGLVASKAWGIRSKARQRLLEPFVAFFGMTMFGAIEVHAIATHAGWVSIAGGALTVVLFGVMFAKRLFRRRHASDS